MKKLLIVTDPTIQEHLDAQKEIELAGKESKPPFVRILSTAFAGEGNKSLEIALQLCDIATQRHLPCAVFEIESELFCRT